MARSATTEGPIPTLLISLVSCLALVGCSDDGTAPWSPQGAEDIGGRGPGSGGPDVGTTDDTGNPSIDVGVPEEDVGGPEDTGGNVGSGAAPGSACACDSACAGTAANPGLCVNGTCMQLASGECASSGSPAECQAGSRCWGEICYPDCSAFECDGDCDEDGSCIWSDASTCDDSCSEICQSPHNGNPCLENAHEVDGGCACDEGYVVNADGTGCEPEGTGGECPPNSSPGDDGLCYCDEGFVVNDAGTACVRECETSSDCTGGQIWEDNTCVEPPCTPDSCPDGMLCAESGNCVADIGSVPSGPIPDCSGVADLMCEGGESECGGVHQFLPYEGPGYWNYPLNGETSSNQYRSFCRNDLM